MNERIAAGLLLLACGGCHLPRDADHTLDRIQRGTIRVGLISNPPWVMDSAGDLQGVEVQLVKGMAADLNAGVAWTRGSESELLTSLHDRELDLVIGGLSGKSPWKTRVAFSRAYYIDSTLVAPASSDGPGLRGDSVALRAGDPAVAYLRKKKAIPVPVDDLARAQGPVAAPAWKLAVLRRPGDAALLHAEQRVMAVAPGENAWLSWVEHWLARHRSSVPAMLRAGGQ
jgi:polar amino acid transport system substrate-binding protein